MADCFFDTSAAAKRYRVEVGTAKVDAFLAEPGARYFLSVWCRDRNADDADATDQRGSDPD